MVALARLSETFDNVRFIAVGGVSCEPGTLTCTPRTGFDPQKGPMTTQTFRGMLEPLHWRGDRPTMRDFNGAFVGLMGVEDISSTETGPAGLPAGDMDLFRQFALQITYPPNPYRNVDDTSPCGIRATDPTCEVDIHGALFPGNPTEGDRIFHEVGTDGGGTCQLCHSHPAGTAGGTLGVRAQPSLATAGGGEEHGVIRKAPPPPVHPTNAPLRQHGFD